MKMLIAAIIMAVTSVSAMASTEVVFEAGDYQILSETPYKDGGSIKFNKMRIAVEGKVMRLAPSLALKKILTNVCKETGFKYVYLVHEHAGIFEKSVSIMENELIKEKNEVVVMNLACMEQDY